MAFNSAQFLLFFCATLILFQLTPRRFRWALLLAASLFFYGSFAPICVLYISIVIAIGYATGLALPGSGEQRRKPIMAAGVILSLIPMFLFKYLFVLKLLVIWPIPRLLAPIGLSFYIFQNIGYIIDVYRGTVPAERHLGMYALFILFYPQLVMGPIERAHALIPQLRSLPAFDYDRLTSGLKLMAWGLFKKEVIADRLSIYINPVFNSPHGHSEIQLALAVVFYAWQIYFDFCAYMDIAIGVAKTFGISLSDNFQRPYQAQSISQFWQRWHITLSHWLRDYLFLPVSYALLKRLPHERTWGVKSVDMVYSAAIMLTMIACGFWHGAAWTFLAWGALHGFYLIFSHLSKPLRSRLRRQLGLKRNGMPHVWLQKTVTFVLVSWAWIFFRAKSMGDAWYIATRVLRAPFRLLAHLDHSTLVAAKKGLPMSFFLIVGASLALLWLLQKAQTERGDRYMLDDHPLWLRWSFYYIVILAIHFFGVFTMTTDFLYFQF